MKFITYCNPLPGSNFLEDLKYVAVSALFAKRAYPESEFICATCGELPDFLRTGIKSLYFPFDKIPFAMARADFLRKYVSAPLFDCPTIFMGRDVLVLRNLDEGLSLAPVITNYRYNLAMPYCSDFIYANPTSGEGIVQIKAIFEAFFNTHLYMPGVILDSWADQLSWASVLGLPSPTAFTGEPFNAPRVPSVVALPADPWFLTPRDCFPSSLAAYDPGATEYGQPFGADTYREFLDSKFMLHFKGNRKHWQLSFSDWAIKSGIIDYRPMFPDMPSDYLCQPSN
jgi:hypothetical protein